MNTRNIQTFLMVSAAFFAMSAPVRSNSANTLAAAVSRTMQVASSSRHTEELQASSQAGKNDRRS
ncbi:MAG TPA: hypothetical protein VEI25_11420 [Paraburkholderia sp.]|nr:hypothetical protein [Paraburkholderia sp.]